MSSSDLGGSFCWTPSRGAGNNRKSVLTRAASSSASQLDMVPIEVLSKVIDYLEILDLFVLSLCSREWLCKAWNFRSTLELRPFCLASLSASAFPRSVASNARLGAVAVQIASKGVAIDITKVPKSPVQSKRHGNKLSKSGSHGIGPDKGKTMQSEMGEGVPPKLAHCKKKSPSDDAIRESRTKSISNRLSSSPETSRSDSPSKLSKSASILRDSPSSSSSAVCTTAVVERMPSWNVCHFLRELLPRFPSGQLVELSLAGCVVYPRVFKRIAATECRTSLLALNLESCIGMSSSCMHYIAKMSGLQYLNLRGCDGMGESSLKHLRVMIGLTYLDVKDILCVKRVNSSSAQFPFPISSDTPHTSRSAMDNALAVHSGSYFEDKISQSVSFLTTDIDSSDDSDGELDDALPVRRRAEIPLEWYTPSHWIVDAVSRLTRLVVLNMSEWNKNLARSENTDLLVRLQELRALQLQHGGCVDALAQLPHLASLSFATTTYANYYVLGTHFAGTSFPHLKSLNFTNCYRINDAALAQIVESAPNLQDLKLCSCDGITDSSLIDTLPKLHASLESLDLRHIDALTESGLVHLSKLTNLKTLSLRHLPGLQSCALFTNLTSLKALDLSYCVNVANESIPDLAACHLQRLALRGLKLIGLPALRPIFNAPCSLTSIDLQECPTFAYAVTTAKSAWRELRRLLPACLQECLVSSKNQPSTS